MPAKHNAAVPHGPCNRGLGAAFDVLNIGNPVTLPSRKARLFPFTIEACRRTTKERLVNALDCVDADNRVKMVVDPTDYDGHDPAPGAGVELCGSGTECVLGYERRIFDYYLQSAVWIGGPYATVLGAKRAGASASWNFGWLRLPCEGEGDVPAVTLTVDQHARDSPLLQHLTVFRQPDRSGLLKFAERADAQ